MLTKEQIKEKETDYDDRIRLLTLQIGSLELYKDEAKTALSHMEEGRPETAKALVNSLSELIDVNEEALKAKLEVLRMEKMKFIQKSLIDLIFNEEDDE